MTMKKRGFRKPLLRKNPSQLKQMTAAAMGAEEEVEQLQTKVRKLQGEIRKLRKENAALQELVDKFVKAAVPKKKKKVDLKAEAEADEALARLQANEPPDDEDSLIDALDEAGPEEGDELDPS
jgi:predicted nuclease with TOPRIM domain